MKEREGGKLNRYALYMFRGAVLEYSIVGMQKSYQKEGEIKMKTAVIYKSFLGTTEKYSKWLNEEINVDLFKFSQIKRDQFDNYDILIISSGTYAGWMPLTGYLKKIWQYIKNKKLVVVAVGAAPEDDEWSKKSYKRIPIDIRSKIKYFKIPGKLGKQTGKDIKKENLEPIIKYIRSL